MWPNCPCRVQGQFVTTHWLLTLNQLNTGGTPQWDWTAEEPNLLCAIRSVWFELCFPSAYDCLNVLYFSFKLVFLDWGKKNLACVMGSRYFSVTNTFIKKGFINPTEKCCAWINALRRMTLENRKSFHTQILQFSLRFTYPKWNHWFKTATHRTFYTWSDQHYYFPPHHVAAQTLIM